MLARLVARSKSRPDVSPGRALFVAAFIGFWMFAISARLVYLQFSQYENLANRARQQQQNAIETSPLRGELLDRQGRQLARSVQTVSLFLDPDGLDTDTLDRNAKQLAQTLGLKQADLAKEFREAHAERTMRWRVGPAQCVREDGRATGRPAFTARLPARAARHHEEPSTRRSARGAR